MAAWIQEVARSIKTDGSNIDAVRKIIADRFDNIRTRQKSLSQVKTEFENTRAPTQQFLDAATVLVEELNESERKGANKVAKILSDVLAGPPSHETHRALANLYFPIKKGSPVRFEGIINPHIIGQIAALPQPWPQVQALVLQREAPEDGGMPELNEFIVKNRLKRNAEKAIQRIRNEGDLSDNSEDDEADEKEQPKAALHVHTREEADEIIESMKGLLKSVNPALRVYAAMFLTGRRMADLVTANFRPIHNKPRELTFTNGSKRRSPFPEAINIPLLADAEQLLPVLAQIKTYLNDFRGTSPKDKAMAFRASAVGRDSLADFRKTMRSWLLRVLDGQPPNSFTAHKFRKLYAAVLPFVAAHQGNSADFVRKSLGHATLAASRPYLGNHGGGAASHPETPEKRVRYEHAS